MRIVVALGGNALLRRGQPMTIGVQRTNVRVACEALAPLALEHELVVSHGNGPQVGLLALQGDSSDESVPAPLDVLDAETEGMVGYLVEQELGRHLPRERIATLLTQVVVDERDPAFKRPTKPIGPVYADGGEAERLAAARGWSVRRDTGGWRRVVPSPEPRRIVELDTIRLLVDHGVVPICVGGGGIPVVPDGRGGLRGVEAVIDKDLAAALLATSLDADALLRLTDVDGVYADWGGPAARLVRQASVEQLRALPGLPSGSMGPKVEAVCRFVEAGGRLGGIGALADAAEILAGTAGTVVRGGGRS